MCPIYVWHILIHKSKKYVWHINKRVMSHIYVSYKCVTCIRSYVKKRMYALWISESCLTYMCPYMCDIFSFTCQKTDVWHTHKAVMSHIYVSYICETYYFIFLKKKFTCDKERASSFSHMNEWCPTIEGIRSHIGLSHITHMNESCHTYGWVMNSFERVTSHIELSRITPINESRHTCG